MTTVKIGNLTVDASRYSNVPYSQSSWLHGFRNDCTGLVSSVYSLNGFIFFDPDNGKVVNTLTTNMLVDYTTGKPTEFAKANFDIITVEKAATSDVLVFNKSATSASGHVGIYNGDNTMTHMGTSNGYTDKAALPKMETDAIWSGKPMVFALRPKASTYVAELDVFGSARPSNQSSAQGLLTNYLHQAEIEGYRAGIYSDSRGIPTVGNGYALVVGKSENWQLRSSEELRKHMRDAGFSEEEIIVKLAELPLQTLDNAITLLNQKKITEAKALFPDGASPSWLTSAEADRLTASFSRDNVVKAINTLGVETWNGLTDTQQAGILSRMYQTPAFLNKWPSFVSAIKAGDMAGAAEIIAKSGGHGAADAQLFGAKSIVSPDNPALGQRGGNSNLPPTPGNPPLPSDVVYFGGNSNTVKGYLNLKTGDSYQEFKQDSGEFKAGDKIWEWGNGTQQLVIRADGEAEYNQWSSFSNDWIPYSRQAAPERTWSIPQNDGEKITYQLFANGEWTLTRTDRNGALLDTTESLKGGWLKTNPSGFVLDGYFPDGRPLLGRVDPNIEQVSFDNVIPVLQYPEYRPLSIDGFTYQLDTATGLLYRDLGQGQFDVINPKTNSRVLLTESDVTQIGQGQGLFLTDSGQYSVGDLPVLLASYSEQNFDMEISDGQWRLQNDHVTLESTDSGMWKSTATDSDENITSQASIQFSEEDGSPLETVTYANGRVVELSYDGDGKLLSQKEIASGGQTLQNAIGQYGGTLLDALSLVKAIQSGEPLPVVASGLRLANAVSTLDGTLNLELNAASNTVSGVLSLYGLAHALENGDTLAAVSSGMQAVQFGAFAYSAALRASEDALLNISEIQAADAVADTLGEALPFLNLVNSLAHEDYVGAAVSALSIAGVPYIGWAYAVYSIVDSLFNSDDIPATWGSGQFIWNGNSISYSAVGETGGKEAVEGIMGNTLATLNAMIEQVRQQNPGSQLGLIPNRMPSTGYDTSGYRYTDIDPLSGAEQHPSLRFDTNGRPYNAEPGSPESFQSIIEAMVRSALQRGAIAPLWEVQTAKLQSDAGDPQAGLREEERAARDSMLAVPLTGSTQTFRPVALDLDGDGIEAIDKAAGVAFNIDDSGYLKQTAWIKGDDAFLVLDRDYNGSFDSGRELFSNSVVAPDRRGLAAMLAIDANYDGKITTADPVWSELKLWRDQDNDGTQGIGEIQSLASQGISELNYAMATFTRNGVKQQLASPDLTADLDGSRIATVPEGVLVQTSNNGEISLIVTRIEDLTKLEANRDGITGYENTEIIVSCADLLANDYLGNETGTNLNITGLSGFRHGTGFIEANGFIHFIPEQNYAGEDAGFDYIVQSSGGQEGRATVDITLQNSNQAPTLADVVHRTRAIYSYTAMQVTDTEAVGGAGQYISGGSPIYTPYAIERTIDWEKGGLVESIIYNPAPDQVNYEYHTTPIAFEDTGAGRIYGTDSDDPGTLLTYEIVNQPQYGAVTLNSDGSFQYISWKEPGIASDYIVVNGQYAGLKDGTLYTQNNLPSQAIYPTTDVFQVRITDPQGASSIQSISVPHYGPYLPPVPEGGGGGKKPVAVDLSGDGFQFIDVNDSNVFFDVNDDGRKHRTAWIGKDDGLLAYDSDGDGKINRAGEISFTRYQEGAQTDLEGLRAFDSNGDGRFDAADEKWARFGVWQDANQNGITDAGEFQSLSTMGVTAVNLSSDGKFQVINGQTVHGTGGMSLTNGSSLAIADVTLAYSNEIQVPQADGSMATVSDAPFSPSGEEIDGTEDKDLILGKTGSNIVKGLSGDDVIFEDGGNDIVDGGNGNDLIYAGADNDLVLGGLGDDAIYSGLGDDVLFAGEGHDAIFAEDGNDVVFASAGNDLISGGAGNDVLSGDDGDDQIYGESGNDALFGRDGDDELSGLDGNDRIDGSSGNDLLDGGTGADEMLGGAGDDCYVVDNAEDIVGELFAEGKDTIQTTLDGYTLGANIENLTLGGVNNLSGSGNELDNTLYGNWGNNLLEGGAGQDKLDGKTGSDTLSGGMGDDIYVVDNVDDQVIEAVDEGLDAIRASISYTLPANVEQLSLNGSTALDATGNELDNLLNGNPDNNLIDGESGADTMIGGLGNDIYVVDDQNDNVTEFFNEGIDSVLTSISFVLPEQLENLTLTGSTDIDGSGNDWDNHLLGNDGANVLDGAAGDDEMRGGDGHDTYCVDSPGDLVLEALGGGYDTIRSTISLTMPDNVECIQLLGKDNINTTGNTQDNFIVGNSGRNILDGSSGSDIMAGGTGDDDYIVNCQKDAVTELTFGGIDSIYASTSYGLPEQVENLTLLGDSNLDASGNELDNRLTGNTGNNLISAKAGDDQLDGLAGNDTLHGETGNDRILAGAGRDRLYGESGDDYLQGDTGNDMLNGGDGIDFLSGANGRDILRDRWGRNAFFGGRQNDQIEAGAGNDFIAGGQHDDTIQAGRGANVIAFNIGDGNDVLLPAKNAVNTISLGGKFDQKNFALEQSGQNLILSMGNNNQITLKDWYASADNQDVLKLQLVETHPSPKPGQPRTNTWNVDSFDFKVLVQSFDAARAANSSLSQWRMMDAFLDAHLENSDSSALGGELAARYAIGDESGISLDMPRETLSDAHFARQAQSIGQRLDTTVRAYQ